MGKNFILRLVQFGLMHVWPIAVLIVSAIFLSPAETGALAIIVSVATLFRPLIGFSLGRASIRYIGENQARLGEQGGSDYALYAFNLALCVSLVGLVAVCLVMFGAFSVYQLPGTPAVVLLAALFSYFYGTTELLDGIFRAENRFGMLARAMILSRLLAVAAFAALLPFVPRLETMLAVLLVAEAVCSLMLVAHFARAHKLAPRDILGLANIARRKDRALALLRYSVPVVINAVAVYFYARVMVLIVGLFAPASAVGGFEIAVQLTNLPMAMTIVVATIISPKAARLFAGDARQKQALRVALSQGASFSLWINILAMMALALFGTLALGWLFPDLTDAAAILLVIAPLVGIKAFAQILSGEISVAIGRAGTTARITLVFGALNVLGGVAGAYYYGAIGAAWAMLAVHTLASLASVIVLNRQTGLRLRYRWVTTTAGAAMGSLPSLVAVLALREQPLDAILVGGLLFVAGNLALLVLSGRFGWPFHRPLVDALRLMFPPRPKYSLLANTRALHADGPGDISRSVAAYLEATRPELVAFWERGKDMAVTPADFLAHADYVYTKWLLGEEQALSRTAAERFTEAVAGANLAGKQGSGRQLVPHLTAYVLGAANLLTVAGHDRRAEIFDAFDLDLDRLIDRTTHLPRWPAAWSHHTWRVSHWLGGAPAILLNFARFDPRGRVDDALVHKVLEACDSRILADDTGLMRTYRSDAVQAGFRSLYKVRHDPDLADIGGLVHLHWVNHATGRPYKAGRHLLDLTARHMDLNFPFLEGSPYCLDFDYVQLQRTALEQNPGYDSARIERRTRTLACDLGLYLSAIPTSYKLHRLPGALATLHEASMILKSPKLPGTDLPPRDIIRTALWL